LETAQDSAPKPSPGQTSEPRRSRAEAEASAAFAVPRCRSSHPSRERRIHLKTRLAFQSVPTRNCCNGRPRRQSFIDSPLALTKAPRPPRPANTVIRRSHLGSTSSSGGHLTNSICTTVGSRQITLTFRPLFIAL